MGRWRRLERGKAGPEGECDGGQPNERPYPAHPAPAADITAEIGRKVQPGQSYGQAIAHRRPRSGGAWFVGQNLVMRQRGRVGALRGGCRQSLSIIGVRWGPV